MDEIAAKTGRPVGELIWANQLEYPYRLAVGQSLYVGAEGSIGAGSPLLYSFGYAYPFIDRDTLDETLPFLTDIYIFSYGFTAEAVRKAYYHNPTEDALIMWKRDLPERITT